MKIISAVLVSIILFSILLSVLFVCTGTAAQEKKRLISGDIIAGLRHIQIDPDQPLPEIHIYSGDYVAFHLKEDQKAILLIPAMKISEELPIQNKKPYIKFSEAGSFVYSINGKKSKIIVHDYTQKKYTELTADQAEELIKTGIPVILDVRTSREFQNGHIKGAILLPVQELQNRMKELEKYKNSPILIYCATGNRSTVASRLLLQKGFKKIYNLRMGIADWYRQKKNIER